MPLYEYQCKRCGARDEVFARSMNSAVEAPTCPKAGDESGHEMERVVSTFARHLTVADKLVEAEAKWGKEVDTVMGPEPDVGRYARRYEELAQGLPPERE